MMLKQWFILTCLLYNYRYVCYIITGFNRLDNEIFVNRNQGIPSVIKFHPYESELAVADKDGVA